MNSCQLESKQQISVIPLKLQHILFPTLSNCHKPYSPLGRPIYCLVAVVVIDNSSCLNSKLLT